MAKSKKKTVNKRQVTINRKHKDTVFRMVFRDKKNLLELYNALNDTKYTNPEQLEIVTLENAVYMNMKNDLAVLMEDYLNLYEHQSNYSPNMPLRDLFYISKELQGMIEEKRLYGSTLLKIPTPRFVVFYNGTKEQPEKQVFRLSDAFTQPVDEPELELKVTMLNINQGKNEKLLEACKVLREYTQFVTKIRTYAKEMPIEEAVRKAIDECIKEDIMREFLLKNKKEATEMCIFEYDEEATLQYLGEEKYDEGFKNGKRDGIEIGKQFGIIKILKKHHQSDEEILEELMSEFAVSRDVAERYLRQYNEES